MGYFDGLVDGAFKKDSNDRNIFYPWGIFGTGFIVESDSRHEEIRGFYKKMYMLLVPAVIVLQIAFGFLLSGALVVIYCVWYYRYAKKLTKDMTPSLEKLTFSQSTKNSAASHNLPTLILLEIAGLGFVAIGIWMILSGQTPMAYLVIGFFGLCLIPITKMLIAKLKAK